MHVYIIKRNDAVWGQFFYDTSAAHAEAKFQGFEDYSVYRLRDK